MLLVEYYMYYGIVSTMKTSFLHVGFEQDTFRKLENPDVDLKKIPCFGIGGERVGKKQITTCADNQKRSYLPK